MYTPVFVREKFFDFQIHCSEDSIFQQIIVRASINIRPDFRGYKRRDPLGGTAALHRN